MAAQHLNGVKVVYGAMSIGKGGECCTWSPECAMADDDLLGRVPAIEDAGAILDTLQRFDLNEVDCARGYNGGTSEEYLAELKWQDRGLIVATKLSPAANPSPGAYTHKPADLRRGIEASLAALKTKQIDLVSHS